MSEHDREPSVLFRWVVAVAVVVCALAGSAVVLVVRGHPVAGVAVGLVALAAALGPAAVRARAAMLVTRETLREHARLGRELDRRARAASRQVPRPPWEPAPVPELQRAGMWRPDGGPTYFERHGHRPDQPCSPYCHGNPARPR